MSRQFDHQFRRHVVSRGLREVINDDGQRRAIGHRTIEGQQVGGLHLLLVVMWGTHHGNVIAQFGSVFGEAERLDGRFDASAGDQNFIGCGRLACALEDVAPLLI